MQDSFFISTPPSLALIQDGGALPNSVPGLGPGPAAQGTGTTGATGDPAAGTTGSGAANPFGNTFFILIALMLVFMIVSSMLSARKAKKQTADMLSSLKRGDRVMTTAGMLGTVHEVRDDAVVLKIDDVSGARAQFAKHAIQQVVKSGKGGGGKSSSDSADDDSEVAKAS